MLRRRFIRRACVVAAVILTALALAAAGIHIASRRYAFFLQTRRISIEAMAGMVELGRGGAPSSSVTRHQWPWRHGTRITLNDPNWMIRISLWYPTLGLAASATLAWMPTLIRLYRRPVRGHCPLCGYDLRGLPGSSTCPECGGPPAG